ncbi:MAG TPA: hypothetical protein VFX53_05140 [Pedococcus sp.]|nr:hypothetical protein [Pedococcus sp.]
MPAQTDDYQYLREFYRPWGSARYFINERLREARESNAPADAVRRDDDGTWKTIDDIFSDNLRRTLGLPPTIVTPDNIGKVAAWLKNELTPVPGGRHVYLLHCADIKDALATWDYFNGREGVHMVDLDRPLERITDRPVLRVVLAG